MTPTQRKAMALRLINSLIKREGGYVNHPSDSGGKTKWGISERVARRHGYSGAMYSMPREKAFEIYEARYLKAPGFDQVAGLSERVAAELFDTGVNMGPATAKVFLQRCLNVFNRRQRDYADLKVNGRIGPDTMQALGDFLAKRGSAGEQVMLKALNGLQTARYVSIAERRPKDEDFVYGQIKQRVGNLS